MPDTKAMGALIQTLAAERGPGFTAYTERDDGPWYMIAGERDSWHGAERVADTETNNRDRARAFLAYLLGHDCFGYRFDLISARGGSFTFSCNGYGHGYFTAWRDAIGRVFPDFAGRIIASEAAAGGERVTMGDGSIWLHPYSGAAPIKETNPATGEVTA